MLFKLIALLYQLQPCLLKFQVRLNYNFIRGKAKEYAFQRRSEKEQYTKARTIQIEVFIKDLQSKRI